MRIYTYATHKRFSMRQPSALRRSILAALVLGLTVASFGIGGTPLTAPAQAVDVFVAPTGTDAADGSADKPVATLRRALDRVREIRAAEPGRATPVVVEVADGRHELAATLVITPEDSGTEASPTVIRAAAGARPVISGGRAVHGWQAADVDGRPRWSVELADVKAGTWRFAQLFVNDQRRFRPVLPAAGWNTIAGTVEPSPPSAGKGHDRFAFSGDDLRPEWANVGDVEVVAVHRWTMSRLPIGSIEIRGDVATGRHVAHVRCEGLSFAHGNWTMPAEGQSFPQAEVNLGGSIVATAAKHVAFSDCCVRHVGLYALEFGAGCTDCTVERCELVDLGGGGVLIGTSGGPHSWGTPGWIDTEGGMVERISVRDCTIAHGGRIHSAAVGVWIGHAAHCTVEHCDIHDFTYTGVSVGWVWGYADSRTHHNLILRNHIYDIGYGVLSDMGAVYTLGVSPGTVVEGNHIHDITSHEYGGWGLYTDEGSTGIEMRKNLVYRTSSGGFHQHYGRDNLIENNVFAMARDWQIQRSRIEDHTSFRFEKNIVWWTTDVPLVNGDWTKCLVTRANCYWHAGKPVEFPGGKDLAARQAEGQDEGSIVADPLFKDPEHGDFALAGDSPARALGFEPLDPAAAGRRTPRTLTSAVPAVPTIWQRVATP
jgi:hypothetical protein